MFVSETEKLRKERSSEFSSETSEDEDMNIAVQEELRILYGESEG